MVWFLFVCSVGFYMYTLWSYSPSALYMWRGEKKRPNKPLDGSCWFDATTNFATNPIYITHQKMYLFFIFFFKFWLKERCRRRAGWIKAAALVTKTPSIKMEKKTLGVIHHFYLFSSCFLYVFGGVERKEDIIFVFVSLRGDLNKWKYMYSLCGWWIRVIVNIVFPPAPSTSIAAGNSREKRNVKGDLIGMFTTCPSSDVKME